MIRQTFALLFFTITLSAEPYEKVLLPVQPSQIDGAFGSQWHTMAAAHSDHDRQVALKCYPAACLSFEPSAAPAFTAIRDLVSAFPALERGEAHLYRHRAAHARPEEPGFRQRDRQSHAAVHFIN